MADIKQEHINFSVNLAKTLKNTPNGLYLQVYKEALNTISNPEERSKIENFVDCLIAIQPSKVLVLIHGIRTYGEWQELLKSQLKDNHGIKTYPIGYEYFDPIRFWIPLPFFRRTPIDRITRKLRNIQAEHPTDDIVVIAHSNGTYVISKILSESPDIKINGLILCGSIIKNSFRWDKVARIPRGGIINDCGLKDIWPVFARTLSWGYGSSGRFGFKTSEIEDRFHDLDHCGFFKPEFMEDFWIPFILHGQRIPSDWNRKIPKTSWWLTLLDIFHIKYILCAIPIIIYWPDLMAIPNQWLSLLKE